MLRSIAAVQNIDTKYTIILLKNIRSDVLCIFLHRKVVYIVLYYLEGIFSRFFLILLQ